MSIDYGHYYLDSTGTMYKCIGSAKSFSGEGNNEVLMASFSNGNVGDVVYIDEDGFEEQFAAVRGV